MQPAQQEHWNYETRNPGADYATAFPTPPLVSMFGGTISSSLLFSLGGYLDAERIGEFVSTGFGPSAKGWSEKKLGLLSSFPTFTRMNVGANHRSCLARNILLRLLVPLRRDVSKSPGISHRGKADAGNIHFPSGVPRRPGRWPQMVIMGGPCR